MLLVTLLLITFKYSLYARHYALWIILILPQSSQRLSEEIEKE